MQSGLEGGRGVDVDVDIAGRDFEELLPLFSGHYVILRCGIYFWDGK
jgi:hypothetical protein